MDRFLKYGKFCSMIKGRGKKFSFCMIIDLFYKRFIRNCKNSIVPGIFFLSVSLLLKSVLQTKILICHYIYNFAYYFLHTWSKMLRKSIFYFLQPPNLDPVSANGPNLSIVSLDEKCWFWLKSNWLTGLDWQGGNFQNGSVCIGIKY